MSHSYSHPPDPVAMRGLTSLLHWTSANVATLIVPVFNLNSEITVIISLACSCSPNVVTWDEMHRNRHTSKISSGTSEEVVPRAAGLRFRKALLPLSSYPVPSVRALLFLAPYHGFTSINAFLFFRGWQL